MQIKKAAVLGAGVMGAQIAAHLVNEPDVVGAAWATVQQIRTEATGLGWSDEMVATATTATATLLAKFIAEAAAGVAP